MSVLTNIKYQYNLRILEDFISSNNYQAFFDHLEKQKSNNNVYIQLLFNLGNSVILKNSDDIFTSKIIWLSSYTLDDIYYISQFLNFYKNNVEINVDDISLYEEKLITILNKLTSLENLKFSDFVDKSYLYQYLILHENTKDIKFLKNHMPFFSTKDNLNFSKSSFTNSFIYIVDNPYNVYQKIKNQFNGNKELAQNIFLNLDNQSSFVKFDNVDVEINRQGWHTHIQSWTDINVMNSLNGKIILKKDLYDNTFETLSSIILHFIQSGAKIKMDYNAIEDFLNNNALEKSYEKIDISQKEKKFLNKYIKNITSQFNFDG